MKNENPAAALARRKWESLSKTERFEHIEKMTKAAQKARENKLSTTDLAQDKTS